MIINIARAYVVILFLADMILFAISLLLQISVMLGARPVDSKSSQAVLFAALMVTFVVLFLADERNVWKNEFKACPAWVRRISVSFGIYGFGVATFQTVLFPNSGGPDDPYTVSAIPLAFEALSLMVVYSVLWTGYLPEAALSKRAVRSFIAAALSGAILLANHAGYLSHSVR